MSAAGSDKQVERDRYDRQARLALATSAPGAPPAALLGSEQVSAYLRAPYRHYEAELSRLLRPGMRALELGAGTGVQTGALLLTGADVVATDIAPNALALLRRRWPAAGHQLETVVADMEQLPFAPASFDLIASAVSLSYGAPDRVDAEIVRLLRPGGAVVLVDSLDHHPIYRLNRWLQWLRGRRSRATLRHMPTLSRIDGLAGQFAGHQLRCFGSVSFAMPPLAAAFGPEAAARLSDTIDRWVGVRRSAFKFVLTAEGLRSRAGRASPDPAP